MVIKKAAIILIFMIGLSYLKGFAYYEDHSHYSQVFKKDKTYRIFFPRDYATSGKSYPVIYYLHGYKGTYNSNGYVTMDYALIDNFVKDCSVIYIQLDGRMVRSYRRPYNSGLPREVKYKEQYKDYFLEVVQHVDTTYRTKPKRAYRALFGFSMGGFMSWYLAGKFPHLVGTAVNFMGAAGFYVGYPDNHTLYCHRHAMHNLYGINLHFCNSSTGPLKDLNMEVHQAALREHGLNYVYKVYTGEHKMDDRTPGKITRFKEVFNFVTRSFDNPAPTPKRWHHVDLYKDFEVWDYQVKSTLKGPGFICMRGVTKGGLGIETKKWLPDGAPVPDVTIKVRTATRYQPNTAYTMLDYDVTQDIKTSSTKTSDAQGSISFSVNHAEHQIGIYKRGDPAEVVCISYLVDGRSTFLPFAKAGALKLRVLNRGGSTSSQVRATLSTSTQGVTISNPTLSIGDVTSGQALWTPVAFTVTASNTPPPTGSPFRIRFNVIFKDKQNNQWSDELDVPVFYKVSPFADIAIDDGKLIDTLRLGSGNGNGIADPGETLLLYSGMHRLRLYYDDPFVDKQMERMYMEVLPEGIFPSSGYTLTSLIRIKSNCPLGHKITFLANYETKEFDPIKRNVHWGTVSIKVGQKQGKDLIIEAKDVNAAGLKDQ